MIPESMKEHPNWLCWKLEGTKKPPYDLRTGTKKAAQYCTTTYDEATAAATAGQYNGIGFYLTEQDPFCFLDIDHCFIDGKLDPAAAEIIKMFDGTYIEYSQSGHGLHIIIEATAPYNLTKTMLDKMSSVEIYDRQHYIAMTGNDYGEHRSPTYSPKHAEALTEIYEKYGKQEPKYQVKKQNTPHQNWTYTKHHGTAKGHDEKATLHFLENMCSKKVSYALECKRLMSGDWKGIQGIPSHSEADFRLLKHLVFFAGGEDSDDDVVLSLYYNSELAKSVSTHHKKNGSYDEYLLKALAKIRHKR